MPIESTVASAHPAVGVVRARIAPFTPPRPNPLADPGLSFRQVLVDWKNTGKTPIRSVFADITLYDRAGRKLETGPKDYCIYEAYTSAGIPPGETYVEPEGEGYVVPVLRGMFEEPARVEVNVTRAEEVPLDPAQPFRPPADSRGPVDMRVKSLIVKRLDRTDYRYFFDIRNHGTKPFGGQVKITLLSKDGGKHTRGETFDTQIGAPPRPLDSSLGIHRYVDCSVSPVGKPHGNGVAGFHFEVVSEGRKLAEGSGPISEKYEDLAE